MGEQIRVRGVVQGVGFRPTVARLARAQGLRGWVLNDGDGVLIGLDADAEAVTAFVDALIAGLPPLARVDAVERSPADVVAAAFRIVDSGDGAPTTGVAPDARLCPACDAEIRAPGRRHGYPFTTCTHCGPRLSIALAVPWDRANTTMAGFPMCPDCRREYEDEADRRYHAEPIACPACGPQVRVIGADDLDDVAARLRAGAIIALKGLGGYQLVCDATDEGAVAALRRRKHRPHKPLAVMARDLDVVRRYAHVDDAEAAALSGPAGPIVLLDARAALAPSVAPDQRTIGVMLPTTPLHALLLAGFDTPVVCTSGNLTEEPQATDDDDARARLGAIADVFVTHDRPVRNRVDDAVVRRMDGRIRVLRRARGYAPAPLALPPGLAGRPPVLALGPQLKATVCVTLPTTAVVSQHLGDLDDALTFAHWQRAIALLAELYRHEPAKIAVDRHEAYRATEVGRGMAEACGVPLVEVAHHHAHIAAVMGENGWGVDDGPVLGLAWDGLGAGEDGALWGGEALWCDYGACRRVATFRPTAMIGGDRAAIEPWRNLYAHLRADRALGDGPLGRRLRAKGEGLLEQILPMAPRASSIGRLFDAVAAAVDLCFDGTTWEGQAAVALEAQIDAMPDVGYPFDVGDGPVRVVSPRPLWDALLADLDAGATAATIAGKFHAGLADVAIRLVEDTPGVRAVALSGGVWQNRRMLERVAPALRARGYRVLLHEQLPPNDGCIAFGQALVAAAEG